MYTVVAQRQIPASVETVWNHLSKPELLSKWFADTAYIGPEAPLYMETGDGDFFSGRVIEWDPGIVLGVRWKFMGSGPEYESAVLAVAAEAGHRTDRAGPGRGYRGKSRMPGLAGRVRCGSRNRF